VARLRRLIQREEPELTVVDGLKLVEDLATRGVPIVELFTVEEHLERLRSHEALRLVVDGGRAFLLDPATMAHIAPTRQTQGLLAVVAAPGAFPTQPFRIPAMPFNFFGGISYRYELPF